MRQPEDFTAGQIHRFRNRVALYVRGSEGNGVTVYLSPRDANRLADNLAACARDIELFAPEFSASTFRTIEISGGE